MDKIILAIDTASENLGIAIYNATTGAESSFSEVAFRNQTSKLNVVVDSLLNESGHKFTDLAAIAVTKGPGSFTGVRIAMSAAKGFAFALNIPVITVSNMECIAADCPAEDFTVWLSAHGGDVYSQQFKNSLVGNELVKIPLVDKIEAVKAEDVAPTLAENSTICGNGAEQYSDILPESIKLVEPQYVNPITLAKLAWKLYQTNPKEAANLTPLYIHKLNYRKTNPKT